MFCYLCLHPTSNFLQQKKRDGFPKPPSTQDLMAKKCKPFHQDFQVPKMEGFLNLIRLFWELLFRNSLHKPYPYSLYRWEPNLHFRYRSKCSVNHRFQGKVQGYDHDPSWPCGNDASIFLTVRKHPLGSKQTSLGLVPLEASSFVGGWGCPGSLTQIYAFKIKSSVFWGWHHQMLCWE